MEKPADVFIILEIQHDGPRPLIWTVGFGGVAQTYLKFELDRELASLQESRPRSQFKAVSVT